MKYAAKSLFIIMIAVLLIAAAMLSGQGRPKDQDQEKYLEKTVYTLCPETMNSERFLNKVDGYSLSIPRGMKIDMSLSSVRAVMEDDVLRIEIYRQKLSNSTGSGVESYINYSNLFLQNQEDHVLEYNESISINGMEASVTQWSRKGLRNIENDRHYYASVDLLINEQDVLTFLFKSRTPLQNQNYLTVVSSLKLEEVREKPFTRKAKMTIHEFWDEKTRAVYHEYFGKDSSLQWGIFESAAPVDFTELKRIEQKIDFRFPVVLYYAGFVEGAECHPRLAGALENAKREERLVELTLQTTDQKEGQGNMVYDILDGRYDAFLKNYAETVARSERPVLFRLGNEMNGDWCVYSAYHTSKDTEIFKAFYHYVYRIFKEAGADNVIWVWNPNGKSFPDFKWNNALCYYPGDEYVDVVGMTSYNTGTYYPGEVWKEFEELYDGIYQEYLSFYDKPLMITEFSSSSVGGDKEAWVENMFSSIRKYEKIKVAVWWDGCDWDSNGNVARPYFIDESEELIRIFREHL